MPQDIVTPKVGSFPRGDKTPGVDTKGDGVTVKEGRGQGGDGNPPTTQASKESGANSGNDDMARKPRTAPPPRPSGTAADDNSAGPLQQKSDGANGVDSARSKNGMHPRREYNLLALEAPEGVRANAGPSARGEGHGVTREIAEAGRAETPTEADTRQRALQACNRQEDGGEQ